MKTLIVQGLTEDIINPAELKQFWKPCMETVKQWAKINGWDYRYFSGKRNDDFDVSAWNINTRGDRKERTKYQFYKLQWMDGWNDYDSVFWIDADCYIFGNPMPFGFRDSPKPTLWFLNNEVVLKRWHRPNMSVWGGNQDLVQDAIDWARFQFEHPWDQDEMVQALRCINKYLVVDGAPPEKTYDYGLRFSTDLPTLTEEIFMMAFTQSKLGKTVQMHEEGTGFSSIGKGARSWTADSILHFGGTHKLRNLTRFRAWKAYMAYISESAPKNYEEEISYNEV